MSSSGINVQFDQTKSIIERTCIDRRNGRWSVLTAFKARPSSPGTAARLARIYVARAKKSRTCANKEHVRRGSFFHPPFVCLFVFFCLGTEVLEKLRVDFLMKFGE